jgi:hypothetical protein
MVLGKQSVGKQLVYLIKLNLSKFRSKDSGTGTEQGR